ncbi:hypothetical protein AKJ45_03315 [candidate division MSBL1 archaeon SCGC-AAA261F19]|uniref:Probable transcription termination protein NusA n=1 Tax=candidate division MSBL1 archaeon SCGC-AAA261F19 TaxID=1698275 RepID=A0A133V8C1_9EURY|nr:hypothetical protein AKJ45_03315 [candidate division MSBL1 archaeon SCGC-AAA261F19]
MRYIAVFESVSGIVPRDCVEVEEADKITFVVKEEELGGAIGKNGCNIKRIRQKLGKNVDVVVYSDDPSQFIKNILNPADIQDVKIVEKGDSKVALIDVEYTEKGRAIGRGGWNIKRARKLALRHHDIDDVSVI